MGQFGIGQAVRRKEDVRFITGAGHFADDVNRAGTGACGVRALAPCACARSAHRPCGGAARAGRAGGLHRTTMSPQRSSAVIKCVVPLKNRDGTPIPIRDGRSSPQDRVRHVGEAVAMVVAESPAQAKDAAELIEVDYEPLAAVGRRRPRRWRRARRCSSTRRPAMWRSIGRSATRRRSRRRSRRRRASSRSTSRSAASSSTPIEPRSVVGEYDAASGRFTVHLGTQGVFAARAC